MSSSVEQIKEKLDITTVVGSYIKLERAGGNFRARCPFHNEKTPSFMVSPDRGTYHCFGCNKGGDIFSFVEEIEGTDFSGALRVLADRAGVVLTRENPQERNERDRLFALLSDATLFYRKELRKNIEAIQYLRKRGLLPATMDEFQIGFAPDEWHALEDYLKSRGYTAIEMEKTGMSIRGEKGMYDRFRSRIMFPICDSSGRVVGFTGRVFHGNLLSSVNITADEAKYVNSPETPLYNKSKILFGLSLAKTAIREAGAAILVEGQMDLIMAHQNGTKNAVAVSGTALTVFQLEILKRFADKLLFSFDSDDAGINAAKKSAIPALQMGFDVYAIELSGEKDPADLILESPEKWTEAIRNARHIVEFFLSVFQKKSADKRDFRLSVEKNVLPLVASIESKIDQAHFIDVISVFLDISREAIIEELRKVILRRNDETPPYEERQEVLLVKKTPSSRKEAIERKIHGVILWHDNGERKDLAEKMRERYKTISGFIHEICEEEKNALIFEAEAFYSGTASLEKEIEDLFLNFEKEVIKDSLTETMTELRRAELLHDTEKAGEILGRCKILSEKLNKLNEVK